MKWEWVNGLSKVGMAWVVVKFNEVPRRILINKILFHFLINLVGSNLMKTSLHRHHHPTAAANNL
jgi:hypothetical protein